MIPGFPTTTPPGGHDELLAFWRVFQVGASHCAEFRPASGYQGYYAVVVNGVTVRVVYAPATRKTRVVFSAQTTDRVAVSVCPLGGWPGEVTPIAHQQRYWIEDHGQCILATIFPVPEVADYGCSGQFSSWALTGLSRWKNVAPVADRRQWGKLTVVMTTATGTHTVSLKLDGVTLATGSRVGDGSITLAAANSSGISGTVTLAYTGDVSAGTLIARWPASYQIHYQLSNPFVLEDFERTPEGTITDDGRSNVYRWRSGDLAAGAYYVLVRQIDEGGNQSETVGGTAITITAPPEPPTALAYVSGGATNTVVSWTASVTGGATYNLYDSGESGVLDMTTPTIAGATSPQSLAALSGSYTGTRRILVRAVSGGKEEGNSDILEIEYASGAYVPPRPNPPSIRSGVTVSGLSVSVPVSIPTENQAVAPSTVQVFLYAPGASPNYGSPQGSGSVGTALSGHYFATITATAPSAGFYYVEARSVSAAGTQSSNTDAHGPVNADNVPPADPTYVAEKGI